MGALFYRVFLDHSFVPFLFRLPSYTRPVTLPSVTYLFFSSRVRSFLVEASWRGKVQRTTRRHGEDSGNKNTRGSKHSSWGFHGIVITITTPFTTTSDSRTSLRPPDSSLFDLFFTFLSRLKSAFMPHASNPADRSITIGVIANGYQ